MKYEYVQTGLCDTWYD